jgi:hypothetical protein
MLLYMTPACGAYMTTGQQIQLGWHTAMKEDFRPVLVLPAFVELAVILGRQKRDRSWVSTPIPWSATGSRSVWMGHCVSLGSATGLTWCQPQAAAPHPLSPPEPGHLRTCKCFRGKLHKCWDPRDAPCSRMQRPLTVAAWKPTLWISSMQLWMCIVRLPGCLSGQLSGHSSPLRSAQQNPTQSDPLTCCRLLEPPSPRRLNGFWKSCLLSSTVLDVGVSFCHSKQLTRY